MPERIPPPLLHAIPRLARVTERVLDSTGISLAEYRVLAFLSLGPSMGMALAEWLALSPPSVSAHVDALVRRGFVTRERDEDDRRRVQLTVTPQGEQALAEADRVVGDRLQEVLDLLPPDRQAAAIDGLAAIDEALAIKRQKRHEERKRHT